MPSWTADDETLINYELHGGGSGADTLLLLPDLLGAIGSQWREFIRPLAADYGVLLVDLRGHGLSENRHSELQPRRLLQDVAGLLDHVGADVVHVAGYGLGGYLGLMLHLNRPRQVPTLLMHGTKFYWTQKAVARMREQLDPDRLAAQVPAYADRLARAHGSRWRMLVRQAGDLVARLGQEGVTEEMASRVQIPVLVSVGDRDELVPLPEAFRLSRVFPDGRLLVLPATRHPLASAGRVPLLPVMRAFHRRRGSR